MFLSNTHILILCSLCALLTADLLAEGSMCASETLPDDNSTCEGEGDVSMATSSWSAPIKSPQSEEEIK